MRTPRSVDLLITTRCNLRCSYCSHFTSGGDVRGDLSTEEWLQFFDELGRCAVTHVCFQGGEPFIREDFRELVEGIVRNRMRFRVLSNGTLITEEMAEFLAATRRCDGVQVSIDGADSVTHDACRGDGSFVRALDGLKTLMKHEVSVGVRVTIHRQNLRDLDDVARLLLEDLVLPGISTNAASYMGLCRKNEARVQLTGEERSVAMKTILRLSEQYPGRISATAGPLAEASDWAGVERARNEGRQGLPGRGYLTGCNAVMTNMAVRADGGMLICAQIPDVVLGRINKDDLTDVWQHHPELKRFRERRLIPLNDFEFCQGCRYIEYCTGGCPALSMTMIGDLYQPSPDACYRRFLEQGGRLPDIEA